MRNKGITLISLVVTIVVLLILAGITIGTVFDDNGIIKKAQEAANATEDALRNEQEGLNSLLDQLDSITNSTGGSTPVIGSINGKITWSTGSASLELTTDADGVTIQYRKNGESNWTDYSSAVPSLLHGDKVYARGIKDGETVISEKQFDILDTTSPIVTIADSSSTTNSVSATATATDNETGMGLSPKYTFYLKKTAEDDSTYVQIGSGSSTSITKGELEQDTLYTVKVEVSDVAGNKGQATKEIKTSKIGDATGGLTNGVIIASTPQWSNGTASITLSTSSGLTIQYQINGVDGSWTNGTNVTGLHHNDTVFARLTDGNNYGGEASITILDTANPQEASISLSGTSTNTEGSVTATVTLNDNESGVNATASKWVYNTNSGYIGTNESSYNNTFNSNGQTITLQATTEGTYYLHVLTVDNAGNKKETISNGIVVEKAGIAIEEILKDGDYVNYIDGTDVTRKCMVLYDSNSGYGVQIITMEAISSITLGNSDVDTSVSEYNEAINLLNKEAEKYNNYIYSDSARSVGSVPNNPDSMSATSSYFGYNLRNTDTNYTTDLNKMNSLEITNIGRFYWLASNYLDVSTNGGNFCVRHIDNNGGLSYDNLGYINLNGYTSAKEVSHAIRPVFHLKAGIKVVSGTGIETDPYILGT